MNPMITDTTGVEQCYSTLSLAEQVGGISDFTDGIYGPNDPDDWAGYLAAQARQADFLLDQVHCELGSTILDIGCGYGRVLKAAKARGAAALGITLSRPQQERCVENGLAVSVLDYRKIPTAWNGMFDGVVANGSLEHFVQPEYAYRADDLYREMFEICHRIVRFGGRFATTAIHFRHPQHAEAIMHGKHVPYSTAWQFRSLFTALHGWYPIRGQLERCAAGHFRLIHEEDGTEDYRRTSEFWLRQIKWKFSTSPRAWGIIAKAALRRDAVWDMIMCWAWRQSWAWQFRPLPGGEPPPTILYRQVWERID